MKQSLISLKSLVLSLGTLIFLIYLSEAATTPRLLSTWSSITKGGISINEIDPKTGKNNGKQLISNAAYSQVFPGNPAIDYRNQRAYFALVGSPSQDLAAPSIPTTLVGFDLSSSNSAKVILQVPLPQVDNLITVFDPFTNRVYIASLGLGATEANKPAVTMGYVDLAKSQYVNVTVFPSGVAPISGGLGQAPAVLDTDTRSIVMFTVLAPRKFGLTLFNLDTQKFTIVPFDSWRINSMVYDSVRSKIFALLSSNSGTTLNTTAATVDPNTGKVNILTTWNNQNLVFAVGSIATFDAVDSAMYTVMGSGGGPPVALTTVNTRNGALLNAAYFQGEQPQSIFFV